VIGCDRVDYNRARTLSLPITLQACSLRRYLHQAPRLERVFAPASSSAFGRDPRRIGRIGASSSPATFNETCLCDRIGIGVGGVFQPFSVVGILWRRRRRFRRTGPSSSSTPIMGTCVYILSLCPSVVCTRRYIHFRVAGCQPASSSSTGR
jgi:hypothetical protein